MTKIMPVIMSGGAGSRLWPASRKAMPKQLLPLIGDRTMVQQTAARFTGDDFTAPVFICNRDHAAPIAAQMGVINHPLGAIITEPMGRNTAPAAVVAALYAQSRDGVTPLVLLAPADHYVTKPDAFRAAIARATPAALAGKLVTFGITPDWAETGYGYIEKGSAIDDGAFDVARFAEKPDAATAAQYVDSGNFLWNAGLFLFSADAFLAQMARHSPDILAATKTAFNAITHDGSCHDLPADLFAHIRSDSIDYAVMEKTDRAAVVPCDIGWNDIGSFAALHDVLKDGSGMAVPDRTWVVDAKDCLVQTDGPRVALVGVDDVGVIVNDGVVMVVKLDAAQSVKSVVEQIKASDDTDLL